MSSKQLTDFIHTWSEQGDEVADKVTYWNTLLRILGVPQELIDNKSYIDYEKSVIVRQGKHFRGSIDAYIPSTKVLIEQKSFGVDLSKPESRNNGGDNTPITPFQQARRYDNNLAQNEKSRFIVLSNFNEIWIYDVRESLDTKPIKLTLSELPKQINLLDFLVKKDDSIHLEKEKKISIKAGEIVAKLYNELAKQYKDPNTEEAKKSINTLCVRLVFCLYAEDAGLFESKSQFHDYLKNIEPNKIGRALRTLFKVLDKPNGENGDKHNERLIDDGGNLFGPYFEEENPELADFPYVNGGMFADESIIIPPFTDELKKILLVDASEQFDWSDISPTIFGAVFESTLNPDTRRQGGMHYTSVENIHKVIDPLFLNDLKDELNEIKSYKLQNTRKNKAKAFQNKLSNLTFFDPACGSGNFLTETFLQLRHLENEAIRIETEGASLLDMGDSSKFIKVSIQQFYGIEINDFAVSVAKTALWIAEDQMMKETQELFWGAQWDFLPLKTYTHIHEGNALQMDWQNILANYACHYIIGNPPFLGKKEQNKSQKQDLKDIFSQGKRDSTISVLDYVCGWYKKANDYIANQKTQVAFVSTNSITQGEQIGPLWSHLNNLSINFAWKTFAWDNDAKNKAHVHVVIIGFSDKHFEKKNKYIYDGNTINKVSHINPYLVDYIPDNITIIKHTKNIDNKAPELHYGSMPIDNGNLILNEADVNTIKKENAEFLKFVRPYGGGREVINSTFRWCLWLDNVDPKEYKQSKFIMDRIQKNKEFRKNSGRTQTKKLADIPYLFGEIRQPKTNMLVFPKVSSEKREYIPIPFISPNIIINGSSLLISDANNYDFGILESKIHMAWMRAVAGRLETRYQYSKELVYSNFPWPNITDKQKEKITKTAQEILDARKNHPQNSLADLYDPLLMPIDLRKAHKANDTAVLEAYGLSTDATEHEIVAKLFEMYEKLIKDKK